MSEAEDHVQCPIQTSLVMVDLLLPPEKEWLNNYHAEVKEKVTPLLKEFQDERALAWLERQCQPI
jgi:Xaa-Pro aminopeptidase